MSLYLCAPYGGSAPEAGLMYLLANYSKIFGIEAAQLRCNGVVPVCDFDESRNWKRTVTSCATCISSQRPFATWAGITSVDLSSYVIAERVIEGERSLQFLSQDELKNVEIGGLNLFDIAAQSVTLRMKGEGRVLTPVETTDIVRQYVRAAHRAVYAARQFFAISKPTLLVVAGGDDLITKSFVAVAESMGRAVGVFSWDGGERAVRIRKTLSSEKVLCGLVVENVLRMRNDVKTWPREVSKTLDDILSFLGISTEQLTLPLAQ